MPSQCPAPLCRRRPYPCFPLPWLGCSLPLLGCPFLCRRRAQLRPSGSVPRLSLPRPCRASPCHRFAVLSRSLASSRIAALCLGSARLSIAVALPCDSSRCLSPSLPRYAAAFRCSAVPPLCSVVQSHNVASPSRLRAFPCQAFAARLAALPSLCWSPPRCSLALLHPAMRCRSDSALRDPWPCRSGRVVSGGMLRGCADAPETA